MNLFFEGFHFINYKIEAEAKLKYITTKMVSAHILYIHIDHANPFQAIFQSDRQNTDHFK